MEPIIKATISLVNHIQLYRNNEIEQYHERTYGDKPVRTVAEFFVLREIGEKGIVNASSLAERLNISKSGVSKITGRFSERGLIIAGRQNGNEKEVYYSLTDDGQKVYKALKKAGQEKNARMEAFLAQFTDEERSGILKFLTGLKDIL